MRNFEQEEAEARERMRRELLPVVLEEIGLAGFYMTDALTRPMAGALAGLIEQSGVEAIHVNILPEIGVHVYLMHDKYYLVRSGLNDMAMARFGDGST
ncbi:hypothetical protein FJV41_38555 [Myxococcus llanfairpwllgwyngyllgogerychwyrndrobwllllantysiliogogogochensis]|uniref:Uncharacterized protein n=1 Tax=Myxococcus llanfairpwllgwyngyllgogerychwyrndrobwllllantysiliogogogochensis TaxID=2590453 RepID=A0A540WP26_9BACT|nr:hypothetical protein [Myxococcus llanfairpwllgwyngyllgogerychwyrndrobwllllantysiliogogogochensis]TQF10617.1 hypothetical protein FJV41_38555 [Myxococcus llanfairpwllgwyngyllgogerychwyrndrobwllllantysiliogogogochensis]